MVPYLIFIAMSKTRDFLNMALVSQNAQSLHNFALNRLTIRNEEMTEFEQSEFKMKFVCLNALHVHRNLYQ